MLVARIISNGAVVESKGGLECFLSVVRTAVVKSALWYGLVFAKCSPYLVLHQGHNILLFLIAPTSVLLFMDGCQIIVAEERYKQ